MQVASRFLLVWLIVDKFPALAHSSLAYTTMLLAWSITEVIRYSYFTASLAYGSAPDWLKWLRYNTFLVLYPLGIGSEVWMVCLACEPARKVHPFFERCCWGVLAFYAPGETPFPYEIRIYTDCTLQVRTYCSRICWRKGRRSCGNWERRRPNDGVRCEGLVKGVEMRQTAIWQENESSPRLSHIQTLNARR